MPNGYGTKNNPYAMPGVTSYGRTPDPQPLGFNPTMSAPRLSPVAGGADFSTKFGDTYGGGTNWGGVAKAGAGALGMLAGLIGGTSHPNYTKEDFNYDPEQKANKRYNELIDPNSQSNQGLLGKYMRIAGNAAPGKDTLMAPVRAAGGGYLGSAAIAAQQAKGIAGKASNDAFEGWTNAVIGNEANASRYLGLEYDRASKENEGYMKWKESQDSNSQDAWSEISNVGGSLLGMFL